MSVSHSVGGLHRLLQMDSVFTMSVKEIHSAQHQSSKSTVAILGVMEDRASKIVVLLFPLLLLRTRVVDSSPVVERAPMDRNVGGRDCSSAGVAAHRVFRVLNHQKDHLSPPVNLPVLYNHCVGIVFVIAIGEKLRVRVREIVEGHVLIW